MRSRPAKFTLNRNEKVIEAGGELAFVEWIRGRTTYGSGVQIGIGDDAAVLTVGKQTLVYTTDILLEGAHFDLKRTTPQQVGWKAMACSISDVAAMGCSPTFAVCSAGLPRKGSPGLAKQLYLGLEKCARTYEVSLVGGDTTSHDGGLVISVAMLGEPQGKCRPLLRSGAKVGDAIMVTGSLGGSLLGRHLRIKPRVDEALELNATCRIHSMIDLSDGLSLDLYRICQMSHVGAVLRESTIPISSAARKQAKMTGKKPVDHALSDGEDFELLFTCTRKEAERIMGRPPCGTRVAMIGRIASDGYLLEKKNGDAVPIMPQGWEHQF